MADLNRDFIPADQDPGAQGSGFVDFVPAREPQIIEEVAEPKQAKPASKYKELQSQAKELGIKGYVGMKKDKLEEAVNAALAAGPQEPELPSEPTEEEPTDAPVGAPLVPEVDTQEETNA